jgi:hypothetical protein
MVPAAQVVPDRVSVTPPSDDVPYGEPTARQDVADAHQRELITTPVPKVVSVQLVPESVSSSPSDVVVVGDHVPTAKHEVSEKHCTLSTLREFELLGLGAVIGFQVPPASFSKSGCVPEVSV